MFVEGRAKSRTLDRPAGGASANPADGFADGRPPYATITPTPSSPPPLRHPSVIPTKVGTQGTNRNTHGSGS